MRKYVSHFVQKVLNKGISVVTMHKKELLVAVTSLKYQVKLQQIFLD